MTKITDREFWRNTWERNRVHHIRLYMQRRWNPSLKASHRDFALHYARLVRMMEGRA